MEWFTGGWIDKGHAPVANHMSEACGFAAAQDFAKTMHHIGTAVGVAESWAFLNRQLGNQRPDIQLAIAVGHAGELGEGPESDAQDTGISLIGLPCPIHGVVDGLFG